MAKKRLVYGNKLKRDTSSNKHITPQQVKTPEDLDRLDKVGLVAFLNSDRPDKIAIWNMRFGSYSDEPIELEGAYLSGANLEGIHLNYANLRLASLTKCNLRNAQLRGACLDGAFLEKATLTGSDLSQARMEGAHLSEAHLEDTILEDAYLAEANLSQTRMTGAYLFGAHFEGADLFGAYLEGAILQKAHLEDANLRGASLERIIAVGAYLERANLWDAHLEGANLFGANLEGAILVETQLKGANLQATLLTNANFNNANCKDADLRLAHFRDVALSSITPGGLRGVKLYQTYFWGILSLRYEQFLEDEANPTSPSAIWEHTQGRFSEAKDIYKTLKGYFEDAGDYEGANWAYENEQRMEKLMYAPKYVRRLAHPKWYRQASDWNPNRERREEIEYVMFKGGLHPDQRSSLWNWAGLMFSDVVAGYGLSITKPLIWLFFLIFSCSAIYWLGGMVTNMPGCGYPELAAQWREGCAASSNPIHSFLFSLGAMTTVDVGNVQAYREYVGVLAALEAVFGIILTGLFGFVLGNKLRNS